MTFQIDAILGAACALVGWLLPRAVAATRGLNPLWWLIDAVLPVAILLLLVSVTARPLFSGVVTLMLGAGYAYADRSKRRVLAEPIVPTDVFQALDIFRHPQLALPFPHKGRVVASVVLVLSIFVWLFRWEQPLPNWSPWWLALLVVTYALGITLLAGPLRNVTGRWMRRAQPSADPIRDSARFGPFAILLIYALIARSERSARQAAVPAPNLPKPSTKSAQTAKGPLVVIQCESFFDARRMHPSLQHLPLPALDRCRETGVQWGRLTVPSWGANTVRTEFAMLTGLPPEAIGFDRFNPYHRFARVPIASLAWRMRAEGYRTICLHPFDRRFYGRDQVMPNLGFDEFIGEEAFASAQRKNGYVADLELARYGRALLNNSREAVFLFVITMENHGPWQPMDPSASQFLSDDVCGRSLDSQEFLEAYLQSLRRADAMLAHFEESLSVRGEEGILVLYGDHLPSFPSAFKAFGFVDKRSDYIIWQAGDRDRTSFSLDVSADWLAKAIMQTRHYD